MGGRQQLDNERRVAMRRENAIIGGGAPLPPFAENLVFWAPLTEGDLTDHVSGVSPAPGTGSCTWDSGMNAYRFVGNQGFAAQRCLIYNIPDGIDFRQSENYNFSIFAKILIVNCNATTDFAMLGSGIMENKDGISVFSIGESHRFNTSTNNPVSLGSWHELCMTRGTRDVLFYVDKSLSRSSYWDDTNYKPFNIAKAVEVGANKYISVGNVTYSYTFNAYIKDVRIYDRVLSVSEVAQL